MRVVLALVLLLVAVPAARADSPTAEKEVRPAIAQTAVESRAPGQPQLVLTEVKLPDHQAAAATALAAQEMPRRGGFWWIVGVLVVAGVILLVLLD